MKIWKNSLKNHGKVYRKWHRSDDLLPYKNKGEIAYVMVDSNALEVRTHRKDNSHWSIDAWGMVDCPSMYFWRMWRWQRIEDESDFLVAFADQGKYEIGYRWGWMHIGHRHGDDRWTELIGRFDWDPTHLWRRSVSRVATRVWQWMRSIHRSISIRWRTTDTMI